MKWVKLSEKLPHPQQEVYLKGYNQLDKGWVKEDGEYIRIRERYSTLDRWTKRHEELNNIFWLDESEQEERTFSLKECPHCQIYPVMCKCCGEIIS